MRTLLTLLTTLTVAVVLAGCATDDPPMPSSRPPATAAPPPTNPSSSAAPTETTPPSDSPAAQAPGPALDVSVDGDQIGPNAKRIEVQTGESLTVNVTSDRAGQLHVHSKPDQYVDFPAGDSTSEVVIDTPGVVDVEEHDTSAVVAQLVVR